jgi:hypothetical protein
MTPRTLLPNRLLRTILHAESFCAFLSRLDGRRFDTTARAWLLGRRQEIGFFVERISRDYRHKKLDETAAAAAIDAYLAALHGGVATHFGERSPACCVASAAPTVVAPHPTDNTPTTMYVKPRPLAVTAVAPPPAPPRAAPPRPWSPGPDSATFVDVEPEMLLAGLETRMG